MGRIACLCGNILSDVCGSDAEAFCYNENISAEYYEIGEGREILECDECGCLLIEDPKQTCKVKFYLPENKKCNHLFIEKSDV